MAATPELRAEIISIGTELLLGEIVDTNAAWLAAQLPALGIPLFRIQQVGDNRARLTETLRQAWARAPLLILTGGLGPTEDDVTREAIADLLGQRMIVSPALEADLRAFFAQRGRTMPESNVKQATTIDAARVLANPIGTAPGWWVKHERRYIATMPGVPVEMRRMWREEVVPRLLTLPRGGTIVSRTLKILGIGESAVEQQLGALVRGTNPTVATYARADGIHVRLAARAESADEARKRLAAAEAEIRAIFGEAIFGVDDEDLAAATRQMLTAARMRVAVGESGLSGSICQALAGVLAGGLVLPRPEEQETPERLPTAARELAQRARNTYNATVALGAALASGPHPDQARVAVAVLVDNRWTERTEEHRTTPADASRRAVLLAMRLVRETVQAT